MWAAAVGLGAAGPVNRSTGAANGEDADDKADKSVDEDCSFVGRFRSGAGEASGLTYWPAGSAMVDSICCGLLGTVIVYRRSSGGRFNRACEQQRGL
jgi:hypothetical protein